MEVQILPCMEQLFRSASVTASGCGLSLATSWAPCSHQSARETEQVSVPKFISSGKSLDYFKLHHAALQYIVIAELVPDHPSTFAAVYNFQTANGVKWEQSSNSWGPSSLFKAAWMPLWSTLTWTPLLRQLHGLCRPSCCELIPGWDMLPIEPSSGQSSLGLALQSQICLWQHQPVLGNIVSPTYFPWFWSLLNTFELQLSWNCNLSKAKWGII